MYQVYEEGTHLMLPWFDRPIIYDVRTRPNVIQSTSGSKDLQMVSVALPATSGSQVWLACGLCPNFAQMQVNIGLRVLTRPLPAKLPEIYRTLGTDYAERVLPSIIQVMNAKTVARLALPWCKAAEASDCKVLRCRKR